MKPFRESGKQRPVAQIGSDGEVWVYRSITEANAKTYVNVSGICLCCQGKVNQAGGYKWRYTEDLTPEQLSKAQVIRREIPESYWDMETR